MQVMTGNVCCQLCEEREKDWEHIQTLSYCLDVIAANLVNDDAAEMWGDLFTKLNGVMVRLENKWREIDGQ